MRAHTTAVLAGVALLSLMAGCSDDTSEFPVGVYHPIDSSESEGTMEFKSDGTWILQSGSGTVYSQGTYTVDGDKLTWETDSYCKNTNADAESAVYTWTQDGTTITMTQDGTDPCDARVEVIGRGFEKVTD